MSVLCEDILWHGAHGHHLNKVDVVVAPASEHPEDVGPKRPQRRPAGSASSRRRPLPLSPHPSHESGPHPKPRHKMVKTALIVLAAVAALCLGDDALRDGQPASLTDDIDPELLKLTAEGGDLGIDIDRDARSLLSAEGLRLYREMLKQERLKIAAVAKEDLTPQEKLKKKQELMKERREKLKKIYEMDRKRRLKGGPAYEIKVNGNPLTAPVGTSRAVEEGAKNSQGQDADVKASGTDDLPNSVDAKDSTTTEGEPVSTTTDPAIVGVGPSPPGHEATAKPLQKEAEPSTTVEPTSEEPTTTVSNSTTVEPTSEEPTTTVSNSTTVEPFTEEPSATTTSEPYTERPTTTIRPPVPSTSGNAHAAEAVQPASAQPNDVLHHVNHAAEAVQNAFDKAKDVLHHGAHAAEAEQPASAQPYEVIHPEAHPAPAVLQAQPNPVARVSGEPQESGSFFNPASVQREYMQPETWSPVRVSSPEGTQFQRDFQAWAAFEAEAAKQKAAQVAVAAQQRATELLASQERAAREQAAAQQKAAEDAAEAEKRQATLVAAQQRVAALESELVSAQLQAIKEAWAAKERAVEEAVLAQQKAAEFMEEQHRHREAMAAQQRAAELRAAQEREARVEAEKLAVQQEAAREAAVAQEHSVKQAAAELLAEHKQAEREEKAAQQKAAQRAAIQEAIAQQQRVAQEAIVAQQIAQQLVVDQVPSTGSTVVVDYGSPIPELSPPYPNPEREPTYQTPTPQVFYPGSSTPQVLYPSSPVPQASEPQMGPPNPALSAPRIVDDLPDGEWERERQEAFDKWRAGLRKDRRRPSTYLTPLPDGTLPPSPYVTPGTPGVPTLSQFQEMMKKARGEHVVGKRETTPGEAPSTTPRAPRRPTRLWPVDPYLTTTRRPSANHPHGGHHQGHHEATQLEPEHTHNPYWPRPERPVAVPKDFKAVTAAWPFQNATNEDGVETPQSSTHHPRRGTSTAPLLLARLVASTTTPQPRSAPEVPEPLPSPEPLRSVRRRRRLVADYTSPMRAESLGEDQCALFGG